MDLTSEQADICADPQKGVGLVVVNACAGSGKSTTLRLLAEAHPRQEFLYLCYNKTVAEAALRAFPPNVRVSTVHGQVAEDFLNLCDADLEAANMTEPEFDEEVNLIYVALTRTREALKLPQGVETWWNCYRKGEEPPRSERMQAKLKRKKGGGEAPLIRFWIRYLGDPKQRGKNAIPREGRGNAKTFMTKADFFLGRGRDSVWLGSVGSHGRPEMLSREIVCFHEGGRCDGAHAVPSEMGWPWRNGRTTEYTSAFDEGEVFVSVLGGPWFHLHPWRKEEGVD